MTEGLYYVVDEGTNNREMLNKTDYKIYDTEEIAQEHIDSNRAARTAQGLSNRHVFVPISIDEYHEKYLRHQDNEIMISDEATKVIDDWMESHGFETRYLALDDLVIKFDELRAEHDTREAMMPAED